MIELNKIMSEFEDKIQLWKDKRIIESVEKKITQKLESISKNLGRPIISEYGVDEEDLPITEYLGHYFDGLKYGINLCITCMIYEDKLVDIKATYNGYLVYHEIEGTLEAYAPFPEWENALEMFYEGTKKTDKQNIIKERENARKINMKLAYSFWEKFRHTWGF